MGDTLNTDGMLQDIILKTFEQMQQMDATAESYVVAAQSLNILLMVLGIICVLFGSVIFFMWRHYERKVDKMQDRHDEQMKAVKKEHTEQIANLTRELAQLNKELAEERMKRIEILKDIKNVLSNLITLSDKNADSVKEAIEASADSIGKQIDRLEKSIK